jgi:MFS family permease
LLLAVAAPFVIKEPPRQTNAAGQIERPNLLTVLKYIWQHFGFYGGFFTAAAFGPVAFNSFAYWMPTYLQRVLGFSIGDAGLLLGSSTFFMGIIGSLGAGWAADALIARGRRDGHLIISGLYLVGCFIFGCMGPLVPERTIAIAMIAALGLFNVTWAGVLTAALQIVTPARMRGQVSAIYLFVAGIIGLGIGPTLVGITTDFVFGDDMAVGKSIALVGTLALIIASTGVEVARRYFLKETSSANT